MCKASDLGGYKLVLAGRHTRPYRNRGELSSDPHVATHARTPACPRHTLVGRALRVTHPVSVIAVANFSVLGATMKSECVVREATSKPTAALPQRT